MSFQQTLLKLFFGLVVNASYDLAFMIMNRLVIYLVL